MAIAGKSPCLIGNDIFKIVGISPLSWLVLGGVCLMSFALTFSQDYITSKWLETMGEVVRHLSGGCGTPSKWPFMAFKWG